MPKVTLRWQLVRIVALALLPLILIAILQVWMAIEESRDLVASRLRANAWAVAEQQRDPFIIAQHALAIAARQSEVRNMGAGCNAILSDVLEGSEAVVNYVRTDAEGRARCSVLPFTPGADLSKDAWWMQRDGRRSLYLASPEIGRISKQPVWIMAMPLYSERNVFQGTVSAGISIEGLITALRQQEGALPGTLAIADAKGRAVAASPKAEFGSFAAVSEAQQTPEHVLLPDGTSWTYVSAPLFRDQLYVVYAERSRVVTRAALSRIWPSLLLLILALGLSSAAIWMATQRTILLWLDRLRLITARFAKGDFTRELSPFERAPSELATFAVDLHDMADAIAAKQQRLADALAHNMALVSEVNHRVRNNLQIVVSILTLQAGKVREPQAALALEQARIRIAALALVHRLMYVGEGAEEGGRIALGELMPRLCAQLRNTYRHRDDVRLDCETQALTVNADQAVALTLFVIEAVGNAFLHAFPDAQPGYIAVSVGPAEGNGMVSVADDGIGFYDANAPNTEVNSVGLSLIAGFAEQIGGSIEMTTGPGGTRVTLCFALSALEQR
jgi:two-component sensor histidine kinase